MAIIVGYRSFFKSETVPNFDRNWPLEVSLQMMHSAHLLLKPGCCIQRNYDARLIYTRQQQLGFIPFNADIARPDLEGEPTFCDGERCVVAIVPARHRVVLSERELLVLVRRLKV